MFRIDNILISNKHQTVCVSTFSRTELTVPCVCFVWNNKFLGVVINFRFAKSSVHDKIDAHSGFVITCISPKLFVSLLYV
jgi:hypothetical protein